MGCGNQLQSRLLRAGDQGIRLLRDTLLRRTRREKLQNKRILIELRGTSGRIRLTGGAFDAVLVAPGTYPEDTSHVIPWKTVELEPHPDRQSMPEFAATIAPVYERLIAAIEQGTPHPCNTARGRRAMEMISAVFASRCSDAAVTLPTSNRTDPLAVQHRS